MKKQFLPLAALAFLAACSDNNETSSTSTTTTTTDERKAEPAAPEASDAPGCYSYSANGDTVTLRLERSGSALSGPLQYQLKEKDRNRGTLTVVSEANGQLRGWYRFQSEGMESVREEVFQRKGDQLVPGYGPVQQSGDTARFETGAAIRFDESRALSKVPCGND